MHIAQTQIFCDRSCADNGQQGQQQYKQRVDVEGHGGRHCGGEMSRCRKRRLTLFQLLTQSLTLELRDDSGGII